MVSLPPDLPEKIKDALLSCSDQERSVLMKILEELSETGDSETYSNIWTADYKEIPVSIDTFIESEKYLGCTNKQGSSVYPEWRTVLRDIFNSGNKYNEIVFTGATRIGKTSTAITATAYMLYKLMCLKSPQEFFGKKDISKFSVLFFNITKDLARGVAFREFNDTLKESPWFNAHGTFSDSEKNYYYIPEGGKIDIDYGSAASHGLGRQIFVGFMDEMNFAQAGIKDINKAKIRMKDTYTTVSDRIKGTFRMNGEVYGKLFAVSSKKSDNDFIEDYIMDQRKSGYGDQIYVFDKPQWEVLPPSTFSPKRFYIAVGSRHQRGFVVPDNQSDEASLSDLSKQGFKLMEVPLDMRPEFTADFDIALRDLAGIAVPGTLAYFTQELIDSCLDNSRRNPFYNDILQIGTKDRLTIEEFFHLEEVDVSVRRCPLYIHYDLSLNTDRSGVSGVAITGRKDVKLPDGGTVSHPFFTHVFSVGIQAPRGDKIPYAKILEFTCWLRKQGFNIERTSRDQFQSEYLGQLLEAQGIKNDKISLDRTPDGYEALKSVFLEQRIGLLQCEQLEDELIHLQRDSFSGAIDHPVGGAKDISDSLAGAVWNATKNNTGVPVPASKVASAIASVNGGKIPTGSSNRTTQRLPSMFPNLNRYK